MSKKGWKLTRAQELRLDRLFKQAAKTAMLKWRNGDSEGYLDLAQDMWVRVLESHSTKQKLLPLSNNEIVATLKTIAQQILSREQGKLNVFRQDVLYSSDNVKDTLKGKSTNKALVELLPSALDELRGRNAGYADAIESRYVDRVVPVSRSSEQVLLSRAVKSLTEILNGQCLAKTERDEDDKLTVKDGPGSAEGKFKQDSDPNNGAVAPSSRRSGEHSDPTANQALSKVREMELLYDAIDAAPITEWTQRPRQVIFLPDGRKYRLTSAEQRQVAADPKKVFDIIDSVLERAC